MAALAAPGALLIAPERHQVADVDVAIRDGEVDAAARREQAPAFAEHGERFAGVLQDVAHVNEIEACRVEANRGEFAGAHVIEAEFGAVITCTS